MEGGPFSKAERNTIAEMEHAIAELQAQKDEVTAFLSQDKGSANNDSARIQEIDLKIANLRTRIDRLRRGTPLQGE